MVGPSLSKRREMLRHAIAHMALEAVARMRGADLRHQAVARHLGDDRGRGDRRDQRVAADHRLAIAGHVDAIAAVDEDEMRADRKRGDRARQRPERGLQDIVAVDARGRAEGDGDLARWRRLCRRALRALRASSFLELLRPRGMRLGSRITAAATTGPASGPRPASSQPATGQTPRFMARAFAAEARAEISLAKRQARRCGLSGCGPTHDRDRAAIVTRDADAGTQMISREA